jgi:ribosomal protein S18 acetylase RimI-like enzyme
MNIRKATEADLIAICDLSNEINQEHYANMPEDFLEPDGTSRDGVYWQKYLDDESSSIIFVAEQKNKVIGFVAASISSKSTAPFLASRPRCLVSTIVISKLHRRKGVGQSLMKIIEGFAKGKGAEVIRLEVMGFNQSAENFYKSLGYGEFSVRLSKSLP